jgi:hypothetical protein
VGLLGLDGDVEEEEHVGGEEREERGQRERVAQRRECAHGGPKEEEREQPEQRDDVRGGREVAGLGGAWKGCGWEGRELAMAAWPAEGAAHGGRPSEVAAPIRDGGGGRQWTRGCETWTVDYGRRLPNRGV